MCVFWYPLSFRADIVSHVTWLEMMAIFQLVKPSCRVCQFQSLLIRERLAAVSKGTKRPDRNKEEKNEYSSINQLVKTYTVNHLNMA